MRRENGKLSPRKASPDAQAQTKRVAPNVIKACEQVRQSIAGSNPAARAKIRKRLLVQAIKSAIRLSSFLEDDERGKYYNKYYICNQAIHLLWKI